MRNAMGLRHVLGILVETRVDADVRQSPTEPLQTAAGPAPARRRAHGACSRACCGSWPSAAREAARVTAEAEQRKIAEGAARSAPVYFGGADNQEPARRGRRQPAAVRLPARPPTQVGRARAAPRPARHRRSTGAEGGPFVPLGQSAEPLIPLLLDARGTRKTIDGTRARRAARSIPGVPRPRPRRRAAAARRRAVRARRRAPGAVVPLAAHRAAAGATRRGKVLRTRVTANGKRMRVRRGVAYVRLDRLRGTVRVRITQRVRRRGKVRTFRVTRTLRVCR